MKLGDSFPVDFDRRLELAERVYRDRIALLRASDPFGLKDCGPWTYGTAEKQAAALEYFEALLLFLVQEYCAAPISWEELRDRVDVALTVLRTMVLEAKWPRPLPFFEAQSEREFDAGIISRLEGRPEWREYESRILPWIKTTSAERPAGVAEVTPLRYYQLWSLDGLSFRALKRLRAGLLQIHGDFLDDQTSADVDCWRRAYDLIAEEFAAAGLLSDQTVTEKVPEIAADASAGGGWFESGWTHVEPSGIFSKRIGSEFYPPWRRDAFLEALRGRVSYWRGRLLLDAAAVPGVSMRGRKPKSDAHRQVAPLVAQLGPEWQRESEQPGTREAQGSKESRKATTPVRRNQKYKVIDEALRKIAESLPRTQEEVFQSLEWRHVVIPPAEPFMTARGWIAGFRRDAAAARAWLSKRWGELSLSPLPRGPKNPRK
jgi:hypothetical protein